MKTQRIEHRSSRSVRPLFVAMSAWLIACGGQVSSAGSSDNSGRTPGTGGERSVMAGAGGASGAPSNGGAGSLGGSGVGGAGGVVSSGGSITAAGGSYSGSGGIPWIRDPPGYPDGALGTGGAVDAGRDGSAGNPGACNFTFYVTTVTYNGRFTPHNVGAIWIESSSGSFVKTLHTWGTLRLSSALQWESVSGGNYVDAVTQASRLTEGPIDGSWNCTDASHQPVSHGHYSACVEFEENALIPGLGLPTHYTCQPFDFEGSATLSWPDQALFTDMSMVLVASP